MLQSAPLYRAVHGNPVLTRTVMTCARPGLPYTTK